MHDPKQLTFEGGVNLNVDPHLLKSNEWQKLQNMWPYREKLIGTRPSLLHEQDICPVPPEYWNGYLFNGDSPTNPSPVGVRFYGQWFRHLTPIRAIFLGELAKVAMICVCNTDGLIKIKEHFEGEAEEIVTLNVGDVILMLTPNDIQSGPDIGPGGFVYPTIAAVRLGTTNNLTPSLINFNGDIIAANKGCDYVVRVVKKDSLPLPSATVWSNIDYRFTKINFGGTNLNFRADGVIVYKNRFVYWKGNKLWFSDPFDPGLIYENAVETAYLAVFFDTGLTEDITALGNLYTSDLEEAGKSVLSIWTQNGMLLLNGEPATTIASTPEEAFANCVVNTVSVKSGCISAASIVKTTYGYLWCGADSVWFMAKGNLPIDVGRKISPRIKDQSFESGGRIFATFDEECYRLIMNAPGVGYNPYEAMNEMWCLSFIGGTPSKETAAWFGPQVFTNTDNPIVGGAAPLGEAGLFCCAKLTNINDDKTWYIQPYTCALGGESTISDLWGTRLGLASISTYLGVDITAPFRPVEAISDVYDYSIGAIFHMSRGKSGEVIPYMIEHMVTVGGVEGVLQSVPIYQDDSGESSYAKRQLAAVLELTDLMPLPYRIQVQSGNMTFDAPELMKLIDGYELTFKTLNPVIISTYWWPWEPHTSNSNVVVLESEVNVPQTNQNVLGNFWNEAVLTSRRIPAPFDRRYNGLTAQLNIVESDLTVTPDYKIVTSNNRLTSPNWNKIKISSDGNTWVEFDLFDYDANGIAKYQTLLELQVLLNVKLLAEMELALDFDPGIPGVGIKFSDDSPLYIDFTGQGWEWFGFVPTNVDVGFGTNIISNVGFGADYLYATGPVPASTPSVIHFAKLAVRYSIFEARPR